MQHWPAAFPGGLPSEAECVKICNPPGALGDVKLGTLPWSAIGSVPTPASITLTFAEHSGSGGAIRSGYIKITCDASVTSPRFTTIGDTRYASFYEVDVTAACSRPPPMPPQLYQCVADGGGGTFGMNCEVAADGSPGMSLEECKRGCGKAPASLFVTEERL